MNCSPWTIDTTATTAATPMMIPRVVRIARILLARRAVKAMRKFSRTTIRPLPRRGVRRRGARGRLVGEHPAVAQLDLAPAVRGDVRLVSDPGPRLAARVQLAECPQ